MTTSLPQKADDYFREQVLLPNWDKTNVKGYDPSTDSLPTGTSISNVGAKYPNIVIQTAGETAGGASGYDYLKNNGPGQVRNGSLIATVRAQDGTDGPLDTKYENDNSPQVTAEDIVTLVRQEIERICLHNPRGDSTEFTTLSSFTAADVPDDIDSDPAVRIEDVTINYSWLRD